MTGFRKAYMRYFVTVYVTRTIAKCALQNPAYISSFRETNEVFRVRSISIHENFS